MYGRFFPAEEIRNLVRRSKVSMSPPDVLTIACAETEISSLLASGQDGAAAGDRSCPSIVIGEELEMVPIAGAVIALSANSGTPAKTSIPGSMEKRLMAALVLADIYLIRLIPKSSSQAVPFSLPSNLQEC